MIHAFDREIATEYGLLEAIILNHIYYWVDKNEVNGKHYHDGKYWTYGSAKGFEATFTYATAKQIRTALDHLRAAGILETGCYNEKPWDRTLWYAITPKGKSILHAGKMDSTHGENGDAPQGTPIPNNNTNNKTDNKEYVGVQDAPPKKEAFKKPTLEEVQAYCEERHNGVDAERFFNYYESVGWRVGKNPMKDWRAAVRTWERSTPKRERRSDLDDIF